MDGLKRDLAHAIRSFRRSPGLVAVASVSLALGIASNVTIFTAISTLIWNPAPYPDPDRLVQVWSTDKERGWNELSISLPDFVDWRQEAKSATLAAESGTSFNFAEGDRPERLMAMTVSPEFFPILEAQFSLGQGLRPSDAIPGAARVAVLSHRFWTRRFGSDTTLVGRTILLDGEPYQVLGIAAPSFRWGDNSSDVWVPLVADQAASRSSHSLRVIGRLTEGATLDRASAELGRIAQTLAIQYPETNKGLGVRIIPLAEEIVERPARQAATITLVAVAFVLLIACANVANLLLARATGRDRELAVRSALGADRGRLVRELLTESMILAVVGGLLGMALSFAGVGWFRSLLPPDFPRVDQFGMVWEAGVFATIITVASGVVFGIVPAWRSTRPDLVTSLRDGGRGMTGLRHGRLLAGLVAFEIALALVLLISAGLLIKGSIGIQREDPGFDPTSALTFRTALSEKEYPDSASVVRFQEQLRDRLVGLEGVAAVGAVSSLPLDGGSAGWYLVDGEPEPEKGRGPVTQVRGISPGYLTAIGINLLAGRDFQAADRFEAPRAALISESLAKRHWAGGNPLGGRIRIFDGWWTIVGVVQDTREFGLDDPAPPTSYLPVTQAVYRRFTIVLKTARDPTTFVPSVQNEIRALAPNQPIYQVQTLAVHFRDSLAEQLIMPRLLTVLGAMALLLAVIGVYGVIAYSVAQRTQEMGVRRALGAQTTNITGLVLRHAMLVCGVGAAAGLALSLLATRGLSVFLYGVSPFDPVIFSGVTAALLVAAFGASLVPAFRATRVDPIVALRAE